MNCALFLLLVGIGVGLRPAPVSVGNERPRTQRTTGDTNDREPPGVRDTILFRLFIVSLTTMPHFPDASCAPASRRKPAPPRTLKPLQVASSTWRIAMGPRAGRKVPSIVGCGERSEPHRSRHAPDQRPLRGVLCANAHGFSTRAYAARPIIGKA